MDKKNSSWERENGLIKLKKLDATKLDTTKLNTIELNSELSTVDLGIVVNIKLLKALLYSSIYLMLYLILIINVIGILATAIPEPATEFYGTARNKNLSDVAIGTNITAYDNNNTLCGFFIVTTTGYYGALSCNGDDTDTLVDEGAVSNENISFRTSNRTAYKSNDSKWVSGYFKRVDLIFNNPPELERIGNLGLLVNQPFYLDVNATDPDNDTLTFSSILSPNLFEFPINASTGIINFTPSSNQVKNYTLTITVSDGFLNMSEELILRISMPTPSGEVGSSFSGEQEIIKKKVEKEIKEILAQAVQIFKSIEAGSTAVMDINKAEISITQIKVSAVKSVTNVEIKVSNLKDKPTATAAGDKVYQYLEISTKNIEKADVSKVMLTFKVTKDWLTSNGLSSEDVVLSRYTSGSWSELPTNIVSSDSSGVTYSAESPGFNYYAVTVKAKPDVPVVEALKVEEISKLASCADGTQNGDETGIDCGGACKPCQPKKPVSLSLSFKDSRFPIEFLIQISLLILLPIIYDIKHLRDVYNSKPKIFKSKLIEYMPKRRKIYLFVINLTVLGFFVLFYLYLFGGVLFKYTPVFVIGVILSSIISAIIVYSLSFKNYRVYYSKELLERKNLIEIEKLQKEKERALLEKEKEFDKKTYNIAKENKFSQVSFYFIKPLYHLSVIIRKKREKRLQKKDYLEILPKLGNLLENKTFKDYSSVHDKIKILYTHIYELAYTKEYRESIDCLIHFVKFVREFNNNTQIQIILEALPELRKINEEIIKISEFIEERLLEQEKELKKQKELENEFITILENKMRDKKLVEQLRHEKEMCVLLKDLQEFAKEYGAVKNHPS